MAIASVIPSETRSAYSETNFIVYDEQVFILRVGEYCPALSNLYKTHKIKTSLFITAYNPYGQALNESVNLKRNIDLATELEDKALKFCPAEGKHPTGDWLSEASYLVLGLSLEESCELGKKYQQNAIVWCDSDCVPQLVLLR
jgi:hypothetical protein